MSATPEREQAEALRERAEAALAITATRQSPLSVAWSNATVTQLAGDVVALAAAASRLVERAEKAERELAFVATVLDTHGAPLGIPEPEYNAGPYNLAGRVDAFARAAVERERELTRALERIARLHPASTAAQNIAREALAGGVSAAVAEAGECCGGDGCCDPENCGRKKVAVAE